MAVLGAAAGGGTLWQIPITYSQTWTPPANGTAVIHCIGAVSYTHLTLPTKRIV